MNVKEKEESLSQIIDLLRQPNPDHFKICDLMYHYNKSLGVTLVNVRKELQSIQGNELNYALKNFRESIQMFKSPNFILDFKSSLDDDLI